MSTVIKEGTRCYARSRRCFSAQFAQNGATAHRYGGEELSAILMGADGKSMMDFAESLRREVEKSFRLKTHHSLG